MAEHVEPFVSIIIPVTVINEYINESIPHIFNMDYDCYEILILPDAGDFSQIRFESAEYAEKLRVIPTGPMGPANKRDVGAQQAKGEILAFLDDDAYPRRDWLNNAVRHFENPEIAAVAGPAVTPKDDSFRQRVSGAVFLSPIGGGNVDRYWPGKRRYFIDDWPSVNLLVRKRDFLDIGGFDSRYWPGEDTKLCLDLTHKLRKKIMYDPEVFVWHHRREGLGHHLKQVGGYGLHRGFFAKRLPETSRHVKYFIPSFFVLFCVCGLAVPVLNHMAFTILYSAGIALYLLGLGVAFVHIHVKERDIAVALMSLSYIFLTHLWYGIRFLQGFIFTRELKSTLRAHRII